MHRNFSFSFFSPLIFPTVLLQASLPAPIATDNPSDAIGNAKTCQSGIWISLRCFAPDAMHRQKTKPTVGLRNRVEEQDSHRYFVMASTKKFQRSTTASPDRNAYRPEQCFLKPDDCDKSHSAADIDFTAARAEHERSRTMVGAMPAIRDMLDLFFDLSCREPVLQ